jgi:hypothetical protein
MPFMKLQTLPHAEQLLGLVFRFTSQPSAGLLLQLPKPVLQEMVHALFVHPGVPFAEEQLLPHCPQCCGVEVVSVSHPVAGDPLQFPHPALHWPMPHVPFAHAAAAFGMEQALPQAEQLFGSVFRLLSQPSAYVSLQLPKPG